VFDSNLRSHEWSRDAGQAQFTLKYWIPIVSLTLSCAGCVRFESKPIAPEETAARLEARRLDDAGLKTFLETGLGHELDAWPVKTWDLQMLTLAAFYFNPALDVARAQWSAAEAGTRTAGGRPNPTLGLTPGYDFSAANGLSPWIPFFNLDVPVETSGKRGKRVAKARHLSESARLNIATVAWQVRSGVRANLLELTAANARAALLEKQLSVQEQIVKRLEQRLAAGAIAQPELTGARIAMSKTLIDLGDAKSKRAEARARLAQCIGLRARAIDGVKFAFDFSEHPADGLTSEDARGVALRGRSDVLGALADYAAAEAELRLQVAKQFPDVHLNPGYQFDQGDNKWTLGISFELPVLNQNQGPIAEARAQREVAAARFAELQSRVIGEIDRAIAARRTAREQLAAGDRLLAAEQRQQQSVEAQLKAGAVDSLDTLTAQLELGMAAVAQLDGQVKWQQSLGALEDALQRPIESVAGSASDSALTNIVEQAPDRSGLNKQTQ